MGKLASGLALLAGTTFGGALHLWLLGDAVVVSLQRHNLGTLGWNTKSPGEDIDIYLLFYLLACTVPFCLAVMLGASAFAEWRMYGARRRARRRPGSILWPLAWALLGAMAAAGANLRLLQGDYREAVAAGGPFAVATIAVGLPAIRDFTLRYLGALAALLLLSTLAALASRRRPAPIRVVPCGGSPMKILSHTWPATGSRARRRSGSATNCRSGRLFADRCSRGLANRVAYGMLFGKTRCRIHSCRVSESQRKEGRATPPEQSEEVAHRPVLAGTR